MQNVLDYLTGVMYIVSMEVTHMELNSAIDFELRGVSGRKQEPFQGMNDFYMVRAVSSKGQAFIDTVDSPVFYQGWLILGQQSWKLFIHKFWAGRKYHAR